MKVLVTGSSGFIGKHVVKELERDGFEVRQYDLKCGADINDGESFREFLLAFDIDAVVHLAAIPRVPYSVKHPVEVTRTNVLGTIKVFNVCRKAHVKRIIFASSSSVYGNNPLPFKEDMKLDPLSPYGASKASDELFAKVFNECYGMEIICLRFFNVYGEGMGGSLVLSKFFRAKKEGKTLPIYGDGEQTRDFSYVGDVCQAIISCLKLEKIPENPIFNIAGDKRISINQVADWIGGEKEYVHPRVGDVKHTCADLTRSKEILNYKPRGSLKKWIEGRLKT